MTVCDSTAVAPAPKRRRKAWDSDLTACPLCGRGVRRCNMRRHAGSVPCVRRQQDERGDAGLAEAVVERRVAAMAAPAPLVEERPRPEPEPEEDGPRRPLGPAPSRYVAPSRRRVQEIPSVLHGRRVEPGTMRSVLAGMTQTVAAAPERVGRDLAVRSMADV